MKKLVLILSLISAYSFANGMNNFSITGDSGLTIGPQEVCNFRQIDSRAVEHANTKCYFFYHKSSKAVNFIVTKEWEARVPHCGRDGECGYRHECVLSWQARCEIELVN